MKPYGAKPQDQQVSSKNRRRIRQTRKVVRAQRSRARRFDEREAVTSADEDAEDRWNLYYDGL